MRSLSASLSDHPMAMLRGIAELRGIALASNVREEAAEQLAAALAAPGATEATLASLSAGARQAWDELARAGGQMKAPAFTRAFGAIRAVGPGRLERELTWRHPENAAEELWYQGLIFRAFSDLGAGLLEYFYIPDQLRPPAAKGRAAPAAADEALPPAAAPAHVRQARNALAVDMCATLAWLSDTPRRQAALGRPARGRARPTALASPAGDAYRPDAGARPEAASNGQGPGGKDAAHAGLLSPDPVRAALLPALAADEGWVKDEADRLTVQAGPVTAWLRAGAWEQTSRLFAAWQRSALWNDLRRVPSLRAEGAWRNDPLLGRRAVQATLARLDPHAWYRLDDLVAWIKAHDPDFERPDGNYTGWYLRDAATDRYLSGFEAWDDVEGRLIRFMITGPLFWLGAVMLGDEETGNGQLFRLTPAGACWIGGGGLPELHGPEALGVNADFTVSAPLTAPLFDRFRLLRFTEPAVAAATDDPPPATLHRITRRSLARARGRGLSGEKIVQFLRRACARELPERVAAGLLRWDQHGGAVRISKGAVLRVEDASLLALLRADPVIAPLLGELLSAQAALVKEANLPKVLAALAELGYTTRVE